MKLGLFASRFSWPLIAGAVAQSNSAQNTIIALNPAPGQAGLGCDWSGADFANFSVQPKHP
jgi:hypothetical protein